MVCLNPQRIFESENFHLIEQHVLSSILKRDDLSLNEFEIWNHIINWGIYNNDDFGESENVHEWSDKEFKSLGETLKELIPLIRFSNMKYKEFHDYVIPYKKILSSSFLTDLEKKFDSLITNQTLNGPTRILLSRKIDSRIIRYDNALKVETWISRSDGTISETTILKYQWKLLFRASLNEKEDYCVDAKGSFIYYFESLSNAKISRVKTDMFYAIPQHKFCGPEFGMIDFSIVDCCNEYKNNSCNPSSKYENTFTIGDFCVEDYEVFQILNK
ncbi:5883_t:CDS:2 [Funneliformis caledonium]|uniref:5883_t:CDS:1 n=1 Tax=Funneliformis caledonium TaxID=1117310 RepID=A0A9N9F3B3_9GLOM|nr:5883_t:CDS:2 [Funneliformis caledonium]